MQRNLLKSSQSTEETLMKTEKTALSETKNMINGEHAEWWKTNVGVTSVKNSVKNTNSNSAHISNRPERSERSVFSGFMVKN